MNADLRADLLVALMNATVALRVAAATTSNGLERARLEALADALKAEVTVQRQKRGADRSRAVS